MSITTWIVDPVVFGLGRIFRLERSALFMAEFRARLELGAINFHLRPCMFTWAKIGSPFEATILALYSKVSSYHLTSTEFLITTQFMISIKWSVDYTIYSNLNEPSHLVFPTSNIGLRTSRHACRLVVANVTFQYPASPLRILQFLFMCNDNVPLFGGGLPLDVLNILEAAGHNFVMGLWGQHLVLSGCMFTGSDRSCIFVHVLLK